MKLSDHGKYITTLEYNKLTAENFDERFRQTNLANFGQKFLKSNNRVTTNNTRTSYTKLINDLSEVKLISTKD